MTMMRYQGGQAQVFYDGKLIDCVRAVDFTFETKPNYDACQVSKEDIERATNNQTKGDEQMNRCKKCLGNYGGQYNRCPYCLGSHVKHCITVEKSRDDVLFHNEPYWTSTFKDDTGYLHAAQGATEDNARDVLLKSLTPFLNDEEARYEFKPKGMGLTTIGVDFARHEHGDETYLYIQRMKDEVLSALNMHSFAPGTVQLPFQAVHHWPPSEVAIVYRLPCWCGLTMQLLTNEVYTCPSGHTFGANDRLRMWDGKCAAVCCHRIPEYPTVLVLEDQTKLMPVVTCKEHRDDLTGFVCRVAPCDRARELARWIYGRTRNPVAHAYSRWAGWPLDGTLMSDPDSHPPMRFIGGVERIS